MEADIQRLKDIAQTETTEVFTSEANALLEKWAARDSVQLPQLYVAICTALSSYDLSGTSRDQRDTVLKHYAFEGLTTCAFTNPEQEFILISHLSDACLNEKRPISAEEREQISHFWLQIWQRTEKELDPDFNPEDVPEINIAPPAETGLPAGVDPSEIEDPELRRIYENDLRKNNEKTQYYNEQWKLRSLHEQYRPNLVHFFSKTYLPTDAEKLEHQLALFIDEKALRNEILNAVRGE